LRFAWARIQQTRGRRVWNTPEILTWDAWLARQWRAATLRSATPDSRQLLSRSQERQLWELALQQLGAQAGDEQLLRPHAAALMRAATRATQSLLSLSRSASTEEESLLAATLVRVRELCSRRGLLSLALSPPEEMTFLAVSAPPAVVGVPTLSPLQQRLQELYWSGAKLLLDPSGAAATEPTLHRTAHLEAELRICAAWCRKQLSQDGARRLLVLSAYVDLGAHTQGALLWEALAGDGDSETSDEQLRTVLAVEGGEPLHHQALIADALVALTILGEQIETRQLLQLLRSPYFDFGSAGECHALHSAVGELGLARWSAAALHDALGSQAVRLPAAASLLQWLVEAQSRLREIPIRSANDWAHCFSGCLRAAGFASSHALTSPDAQRLVRWGEMLDEFAGLDAVVEPMGAADAQRTLAQLARQSTHQAATGDAAITFSAQLQDPVAHYDGIWVLGLAASRWPESPRPDPYVALSEQRHCGWPEAGVTQRLATGRWLLERWRRCTSELLLSYAEREGDLKHRPSPLLPPNIDDWQSDTSASFGRAAVGAATAPDMQLPSAASRAGDSVLRGGVERLRVQQECAFRAQAQWRLGATPPPQLTDGMPARLRGMLLHSLLESLWRELQGQQQLLQLDPAAQAALVARHWATAVRRQASAGAAWIAPRVLERERLRAARLLERVLHMERQREPFVVLECEHETIWQGEQGALRTRIDRIDRSHSGEQLLVDYKSGSADSIRLHEGEARPLQLALYATALANTPLAVCGAALLVLKPAELGFVGAMASGTKLPGRIREIEDWPDAQRHWEVQLQALLQAHLAGGAQLAGDAQVCRNCHLAALCRRSALVDSTSDVVEPA
jgi:ATP-dependent helicase/nuclease subunit B